MAVPSATIRYRVQNIPDELRRIDHWIVFALEGGKPGKPNKVPYIAGSRTRARSNDPTTWRSFETALAAAERDGLYLGFAFTPDLGLTFIDLDSVLGAGGAVRRYAETVVDTLDSYTEASLNGGIHVFVRGRPPVDFTKDLIDGPIEVYPRDGGRFCLVTGDTRPSLGSLDGIIEERTRELAALLPPRPASERPQPGPSQNGAHDELTPYELDAIVEVVAQHRTEGQQHFVDVALGGILAKSGVPETQAVIIIDRLSEGETKARNAIRDSYAKHRAGKDVQGYRGLRELQIPDDAIALLDATLRRMWEAQQPKLVRSLPEIRLLPSSGETGADPERWPEPPPEAFHGWFGRYLELVRETTEAPDQFHLAAALTIIGAYAGRNVYTRLASGRVYPNLYTVLVGLSSESKKDTAIQRAWEMAIDPPWARERTAMPYVEKNGVASAESFIKGLSNQSNVVLRMSEFSEILANARRKGTTTILTMLMRAWDTPHTLSNDSITSPALAINPYVSILAGTQPDVLAADMIGTDISSGFANRILFVPGSGKGRRPRPPEVDERALHEHWHIVKRNLRGYGVDQQIQIAWTPPATELWDHFYLTPRGETTMERTMSQRHQNMVLKVALIFALTDGAKEIGFEHLSHAIAFIDWHWAQVRRLIGAWATSNDNRLEQRILDVLRSTGPIKKRVLQMRTRDPRWSANDFARLVRSMVEIGVLGMNEQNEIGIKDD